MRLIYPALQQPVSFPELGGNYESAWHQPWSLPVKLNPGFLADYQRFFTTDPLTIPDSKITTWFAPFTNPVRQRLGLLAALQQFTTQDTSWVPTPLQFEEGWFNWLDTPVRFPVGLKAYLQQTLAIPSRIIPTPNVTLTIGALEIDTDAILLALTAAVASGQTNLSGAKVSIEEINAIGAGQASIRES